MHRCFFEKMTKTLTQDGLAFQRSIDKTTSTSSSGIARHNQVKVAHGDKIGTVTNNRAIE